MPSVRRGCSAGWSTPLALCFLDLTGYTRLTEERGDSCGRLGRQPERHRPAPFSARISGKPIKWLGDGVMLGTRARSG